MVYVAFDHPVRSQVELSPFCPDRYLSVSRRITEIYGRNRLQTQLEEDSDGETGDASSKRAENQQKQQSLLPPVSPRDLSPLEQKRALRLEMLTRMIGETGTKQQLRV